MILKYQAQLQDQINKLSSQRNLEGGHFEEMKQNQQNIDLSNQQNNQQNIESLEAE